MKKNISLFLVILMILGLVAGCAQTPAVSDPTQAPAVTEAPKSEATEVPASEDKEPEATEAPAEPTEVPAEPTEEPSAKTGVTVRLAGLKGPTTIGMVKLLEDNEAGNTLNDYEFTMAAAADEITPKFIKGELDIVAVPANLGAVLYANTEGKVQQIAVNTLGVIYIVAKGEEIGSVKDLAGKTIYATGKGATPEYALNHILTMAGLDPEKDVTIEWKSEPTEVVAVLKNQDSGVAMLPQPFATVASTQIEGLTTAIDLTDAWNEYSKDGSMLITAGILVRKAFAEEHPEAVKAFLEDFAASTAWVNENVDAAAELVEKQDIVKAPIAKKAIPLCNLVCITGDEMKTALQGYFKVLFDLNPKAVGGAMPGDDYYYAG